MSVSPQTSGNLAYAHDWRDEVSERLEAYRSRRHQSPVTPTQQPALSFSGEPFPASADPAKQVQKLPEASIQSWHYRPRRLERVEIEVTQTAFDFPAAQDDPAGTLVKVQPLLSVAPLTERRLSGLLDAAVLLVSYGGFLTLFAALGGHFSFSKPDIVVTAATFGLFYMQYFTLFTFFGGATPGMMLRRIHVVSFEGTVPLPRQMLWRSFGYVVSAGTLMLGFLWAVWDEDHLCWQDRISQTYLTLTADHALPDRGAEPAAHPACNARG